MYIKKLVEKIDELNADKKILKLEIKRLKEKINNLYELESIITNRELDRKKLS